MARVNAAGDPARAGSLQGLARALAPADAQMAEIEYAIRRLVPLMVAVFLAVLVGGVTYQISQSRDRTFQDAIADLELVGSVVAMQIDQSVSHSEDASSIDAVLHALPERAFAAGRQVIVSNAAGTIVASLPAKPGAAVSGETLGDRLGAIQPLTTFAEKAGVLRIILADGTDAFATVRTLRAPLGQIAIVHPVAGLLEEWWSAALRTGIVLFATAFVLMVIAAAYLWQSRRAHAAERHYGKVHERIDTALNRGRCGLWDWDLARGRIYWSESMYAILGMEATSEFVSFGDINALVHPLDDKLTTLAERLAASEVQSIDHVCRLRNALGAWVWLRVRAELVRETATSDLYLVGIAVDITDEKRLAEKSATADRRLSDAIEAISESFALWDAERRLVTCNAKYMTLHGLHSEAFPVDHRPADMVSAGLPPLVQTWPGWSEAPVADGAWSHETQLGDGRWLQVNELRTKDGSIVSVGSDITSHKLHEQRLMDSERRLTATVADLRRSRQALEMQAQELAEMAERHREKKAEAESANRAKSVFLANMSHELRTPLNAIIGFSDMMCGETFGPLGSSKYADYAADIRASGETLLTLISDVLEMSRLEAGRVRLTRTLFPVEDTIGAVTDALAPEVATKRLRLSASVPPGCLLHADRGAVEKVLHTIIANACKFTAVEATISIRARAANGGLNLFIADDGPGIAPDAMARLGRPFEQIDAPLRNGMKGSGLGLAIARSLVALHGGSLRLKSRLGEGTVVLVHFPGPGDPAPASLPAQRTRARVSNARVESPARKFF